MWLTRRTSLAVAAAASVFAESNVMLAAGVNEIEVHPDYRPRGAYYVVTPCTRLQDVNTLIAGASHSFCYTISLTHETVTLPDRDGVVPVGEIANRYAIGALTGGPANDAYWEHAIRLGSDRNTALVWNGNQHNVGFLLSAGNGFDLLPRGYQPASVIPGLPIVPEAVIREHFAPSLRPLRSIMERLGNAERYRRVIVGTPAPLADNDEIRRRLRKEPLFQEKAERIGKSTDSITITAPSVRRKLWFVLQVMMSELAAELGWTFLPVAPETLTTDGFLRTGLSAGDATHANVGFGAIMLKNLSAELKR